MTAIITAEQILAHPRFADARAVHVDALVALFTGDSFAARMMADAGVIAMRAFLVALKLSHEADDPATWATPGHVKRWLVERGLARPRRVDDLLARFLQAGYVEAGPSPADRRTRIIVATDRLIGHDRAHLAAYHRFLLELFPGRGYDWVLGQDGAAHRAFRRAALRDQARATSAYTHDAIRLFLARDTGYLAFLLVAQAQLSGTDGPSWTALSDTLGVARSHLRTLFGEAERAGYVELRPRSRRLVEILPSLWEAYDRFLAGVQADQDAIAQSAWLGYPGGTTGRDASTAS